MKATRCNLACAHSEFVQINNSVAISIELVEQLLHAVFAHSFSHLVEQFSKHFYRHLLLVAADSMSELAPEHSDDVAEALLVLF